MSSLYKNFEKILSVYFDNQFISEYKRSFQKRRTAAPLSTGEIEKNQEQLTKKISFSGDFQSRVDLILTLSQERLDKIRHIEFLLHLGDFSVSQGEFGPALHIFSKVLQASISPELESFLAYAYLAMGDLYSRQAEWDSSIPYIQKALELFHKQKDHQGLARCENLLGTIFGDKGDINQAQYHFEQSLSFLNPKKDEIMIGMLELNLGVLYVLRGEYDTALSYYQRAIIKFEQIQDVKRIAEAKNDLGLLYTHKGEYNFARLEYDKSIAIALGINYLYALGVSYLSKAYIFAQTDDLVLAEAFANKAMDISFKINDRLSVADIYKIKGIIERKRKQFEAAENYFRTSLRINQEIENILNEAEACYEFSLMYIETGNYTSARELLNTAMGNYKRLNSMHLVDKINKLLQSLNQ